MATIEIAELLKLPAEERMAIAQTLWESVVASGVDYPISKEERHQLEARLEAYDEDPDSGAPWSEVFERLTSR